MPAFTSKDGTTYSPVTTTGAGSATNKNGAARVTFVRRNQLPVFLNGVQADGVVLNGVTLTGLVVDGIRLFLRKWRAKRCFG